MDQKSEQNEDAPLLVIGAGAGRTGTTSLKEALELLYQKPCYHMYEIVNKHLDHVKLWSELLDIVQKDPNASLPANLVKRIFQGYQLMTDIPGCSVYKQLMEIYPEAKIVLTVRDPESWIQSVRGTFRPKKPLIGSGILDRLMESLFLVSGFQHLLDQATILSLGGGDIDLADDEQMMRGFVQRMEEVKQVVPADRLLIFDIKDGWRPLCEFLHKPIPAVPFPHVNDRETMHRRMVGYRKKGNMLVVCVTLAAALVASFGFRLFIRA